jgi:Fe(3+) dicitrate transport protein
VLGGATENTFGDDNTWESFSYLDGTSGRVGYYGYYNHRETDGFRAVNSDVELDAFNLTLALDATADSRWFVTLENYREAHGEPGGLTQGAFAANPDASTRAFDRFELDRDAVTLTWERDLAAGQFTSRLWFVDYTRYSRRQRTATGTGFGTAPVGPNALTNDIETQDFATFGAEGRYRRDWGAEGRYVFTVGAQVFSSDSPRTDVRGSTPDATSGVTFRDSQRDLFYAPVFAENLFRFGDLSVTPGVRFETYRQTVDTTFFDATTGARTGARSGVGEDTVPLLGLGLAYDVPRDSQLYANVSQAYRPMLFTEAVPNSTATVVAGDLAEGSSWQADVGARSRPVAGLTLDASVFYMEFSDKIGGAGTASDPLRNIGRIEYRGAEAAATYDFLRLAGGDGTTRLEGLLNVTVLDAEIVEDSAPARVGNTPQYAPDHLLRTGLVYARGSDLKIALLGTFMDNAYADDANTATRAIPAYAVWDFSAEYLLPGTPLTLLAGVNNLFDESYYNRVRNDGIDPAAGRNYYVGFRAAF